MLMILGFHDFFELTSHQSPVTSHESLITNPQLFELGYLRLKDDTI